MSETYMVTGERKESFFSEYAKFETEVSKEELIILLNDPKVIVDKVMRKTVQK